MVRGGGLRSRRSTFLTQRGRTEKKRADEAPVEPIRGLGETPEDPGGDLPPGLRERGLPVEPGLGPVVKGFGVAPLVEEVASTLARLPSSGPAVEVLLHRIVEPGAGDRHRDRERRTPPG